MARISGKDIQEIRQKAGAGLYNAFVLFGREALGKWDPYTRELIRLRSAQLAHCEHWTHIRHAEAQRQGLSEEKIALLGGAPSALFSERDQLILQLLEITDTAPEQASDALFEALRDHFSEEQLVQLLFAILYFNTLHRFNTVVNLEPLDGDHIVILDGAHPHSPRALD